MLYNMNWNNKLSENTCTQKRNGRYESAKRRHLLRKSLFPRCPNYVCSFFVTKSVFGHVYTNLAATASNNEPRVLRIDSKASQKLADNCREGKQFLCHQYVGSK
jgi:hypothetical protein